MIRHACLSACLLLGSCGGASHEPTAGPGARSTWAAALFPAQNEGAARVDVWGTHIALVHAGQVYASNGEDLPTEIMSGLVPTLLSAERAPRARAALVGIGSGVELSVLLDSGVASVDLFEPSVSLLRNAQGLGHTSHLRFRRGVPVHERLRLMRSAGALPSTAPRWDLIVHASGMTSISEPRRLYTRERLERLRDLLTDDGVLLIHAQLYEIHVSTYRKLLRTFAAAFPNVLVLVSEDLSSDTLLVGSRAPLRLSLDALTSKLADERVAAWSAAAHLRGATDLAARVLFRDRSEVVRFAGETDVYTEREPMTPAEMPRRPPIPDPEQWESAGDRWDAENAHFQSQFDEAMIAGFYSASWPFGRPCETRRNPVVCPLLGGTAPDQPRLIDLAVSQMRHAQTARAGETLGIAERRGDTPALAGAMRLLGLMSGSEVVASAADSVLVELGSDPATEVAKEIWEDARASADWSTAAVRLEVVVEGAPPHLVPHLAYLHALALGEANDWSDARDGVEGLLEQNPDFGERFPAAWHLAGRSHETLWDYDRALECFELYARLTPASLPVRARSTDQ